MVHAVRRPDEGRRSVANRQRLRAGLRRPVLHRRLAQYTIFFADIVGAERLAARREIPSLTLLNGYTARLINQNELNLREAWLRTEFFGQRLALTAGRLDLTNYFDRNAVANDETHQFLSDALVNNPMLGLGSNGTGVGAEFDPKNGFRFKFGFQQSNPDATNLSDSMYSLAEVGYTFTPFALPEGNYRVWFRTDNTRRDVLGKGVGHQPRPEADAASSACSAATASQEARRGRPRSTSTAPACQIPERAGRSTRWTPGASATRRWISSRASSEKLAEGYYNFQLTERLRLSFHLHACARRARGCETKFGYLLPGVRLQAAF